MMILPIHIAEKLLLLRQGEKLPYSSIKHAMVETMLNNNLLHKQIQGRTKTIVYLSNVDSFNHYLQNHFGIADLEQYIIGFKNNELTKAEAIDISSSSKLKTIRSFKGFLVNSFNPIDCLLNGKAITIQPTEGTFIFIYDYEQFIIPADITIVGIENPTNFRQIEKQKHLFSHIKPLFVSRYPQSRDLIKWLLLIPNNYLHFGDFDFAGLNIYHNEYKKHLQERTSFFIPDNLEELIIAKGNRNLYHNQTVQFNEAEVAEENVLVLLKMIHKYKKGLEQEVLIGMG